MNQKKWLYAISAASLLFLIVAISLHWFSQQKSTSNQQLNSVSDNSTELAPEELSPFDSIPDKNLDTNSPSLEESNNKKVQSNYIVNCDNHPFSGDDPSLIKYKASKQSEIFKADLSYTGRLANALSATFTNKETDVEQALYDLRSEFPFRPLLDFHLLSRCVSEEPESYCNEKLIDSLLETNQTNGAVWLRKAAIDLHNQDLKQALVALKQISASPNYNDYWAENIELFDRALLQAEIYNPVIRIVPAIGFAAGTSLTPIGSVIQTCKNLSTSRADIGQLCLDAGKRITDGARSRIEYSYGVSLQRAALDINDDKSFRNTLEKEYKKTMAGSKLTIDAQKLMLHDSELLDFWLGQLKLFGELKAESALVAEAIRLSSNLKYSPCNQP